MINKKKLSFFTNLFPAKNLQKKNVYKQKKKKQASIVFFHLNVRDMSAIRIKVNFINNLHRVVDTTFIGQLGKYKFA